MKKLLAVVCAATVLSGASVAAFAAPDDQQKLPFELAAPTNVSLTWLGGESDSPTTMSIAHSMNDSMCQWLGEMAEPTTHDAAVEKLSSEYGLSDLAVDAQIDWAIDDPTNGWHYTKYWDGETQTVEDGRLEWSGFGYGLDYQIHVGAWDVVDNWLYPQTVNESLILRGIIVTDDPAWTEEEKIQNNPDFYGNETVPGLKDQLRDDQYTLVETDAESHESMVTIDWTQHTAYVRVRWAVSLRDKDGAQMAPIFSDWSETAGFGKDVQPFVPLTKETLAAPVISDLRYYPEEFNGYPQVAVTLTVPEELSKSLTEVASRSGGISVCWEARLPGGTWVEQQGGGTITAGENIVSLLFLANHIISENSDNGVSTPEVVLAAGSPIELRARYYCNQYANYNGEWLGEFYTDYSEVLTFGAQEMSHTEESVPPESSVAESSVPSTESKPAEVSKPEAADSKCSLCHNCPAPLGICIWIWLVILLVIIVIVVVVIVLVRKNKKKDTPTPPNTPNDP